MINCKAKNVVIGCGISGITIAERLASQLGEEVLLIDKRDHLGGNIYDYKDVNTGVTVHRYGAHIFHTNNKEVWDYLSTFTEWHRYMHCVRAYIDGQEVPVPFNLNSLHAIFPQKLANRIEDKLIERFGFNKKVPILELKNAKDTDLEILAQYVYEKVFLGYTLKQWGVRPEDLDPSVSERVPVYISRDNRYFQDKYQGIPECGYTAMVERMLKHPLIHIELNTDFKDIRSSLEYSRLFYTGAIDEFFDYKEGALPYRSLDIVYKTHQCPYLQSESVINYPENYDYTRSVEYKYFLNEISDRTNVSYEYPCPFSEGENERYYPIPNEQNELMYSKYKQMAQKLDNVYFLGRLGDYKYYNMDQAVARALNLIKYI